MAEIYAISYILEGEPMKVYFKQISLSNMVLPEDLNEYLYNTFKTIIHDKLHNIKNCDLEGRCKCCLGYSTINEELWDRITICAISKI